MRLREVGDAFAHASRIAPEQGAGTLVYVGRFDLAEFAVVLEPDEPLRAARRALYAGMAALADALAAHAPPESRSPSTGRIRSRVDGGLVGGGRLAWPQGAREDERRRWLVFGAMIRTVSMGDEPGLNPLVTALEEEGFTDAMSDQLVESFARHLMVAIDAWQEHGFGAVARSYLERLPREKGLRRDIDDNGDLLVRRMGKVEVERKKLLPRWPRPPGSIRRRRAALVKLLRTIRLDPSDTFVFENAAEPGEWAVSGAFVFWDTRRRRRSKARRARRFAAAFSASSRSAGRRWCRSSRRARPIGGRGRKAGASNWSAHFGAPDIAAARAAAEEEVAFAASLCNQPQDTLIAVHRRFEDGEVREAFRTLHPREGQKPMRAFSFLEVEGEERAGRGRRSGRDGRAGAQMNDFWLSCGHHLLDRDEGGGLVVTDEFLKVYLARPELIPPPEACVVERTLHAALLADPRSPVAAAEIAAIADADARENWQMMIAFRDHLLRHKTLEAAYADLVRNGSARRRLCSSTSWCT